MKALEHLYTVRTGCGHIVIRRMREATAGVPWTEDTVIDAPNGRPCEGCERLLSVPCPSCHTVRLVPGRPGWATCECADQPWPLAEVSSWIRPATRR